MKLLFSALFLIVGLVVGNLLVFQQSCRAKPTTGNVETNRESEVPKTTAPTPKNSPAQIKWQPSAYLGILPGKSTEKDVIKFFGKPKVKEEFLEEDKDFEKDPEFNSVFKFSNVENKQVEFVIGNDTKLVKYIGVSQEPSLTKEEAIAKYVNNFFQKESEEPMCLFDNQKIDSSSDKKELKYPVFLIYPEKGVGLRMDRNNEIAEILYS